MVGDEMGFEVGNRPRGGQMAEDMRERAPSGITGYRYYTTR